MEAKHKAYVVTNTASLPLKTMQKDALPGGCAFPQQNEDNFQAETQDERIRNLTQVCAAAITTETPTALPPPPKNMKKPPSCFGCEVFRKKLTHVG